MSHNYFTADLHFGDKKVMELDHRPFASLEEQDEELVRRWNEKVKEQDHVYLLGDISCYQEDKTIELIKRLHGKKHLLWGNHDKCCSQAFRELFVSVSDYQEITVDGRHVVLCHYPLAHWRGQRYGYVHLYGHTHAGEDDLLYAEYAKRCREQGIRFYAYNVGCMFWDYAPVSLAELYEAARKEKEDELRCD